jgi:hypothetical protein
MHSTTAPDITHGLAEDAEIRGQIVTKVVTGERVVIVSIVTGTDPTRLPELCLYLRKCRPGLPDRMAFVLSTRSANLRRVAQALLTAADVADKAAPEARTGWRQRSPQARQRRAENREETLRRRGVPPASWQEMKSTAAAAPAEGA